MSWLSPTSHDASTWSVEENAYDDDLVTFTSSSLISLCNWCPFLILNIEAITSDKVRFYASWNPWGIDQIDLDVYVDGGWVHVFQGVYADRVWTEKNFVEGVVTKARMRFHCADFFFQQRAYVHEFDFWGVPLPTGLKKVLKLNFPLCVTLEAMNVAKGDKVLKVKERAGIVLVAKNALKGDVVLVL